MIKGDIKRLLRSNGLPLLVLALLCAGFASALRAADVPTNRASDEVVDKQGKAPFKVLIVDFGAGGFSPAASSASVPTQDCFNGSTINPSKACAQHFTSTHGIDFGLGVRPFRYIQAGLQMGFPGDFAGWGRQSGTYQCVSGCTGVVTRTITSHYLLLMSDARLVLPLFRERLLISGGGGVGWLQMNQYINTGGNEQVQGGCGGDCQSRSGHGPTEVAEIAYFPKSYLGFSFKFRNLQISSPGLAPEAGVGAGGRSVAYRDRFTSIGGGITFRLGTHH